MTEPSTPSPAPTRPASRLELSEARAFRSLYEAAKRMHGNPFRTATAEVGGAIAFQTGAAPIGFFNRVVGLGSVRAPREADVADLTSFFERAGIPQSVFQVAPSVLTPEVEGWLAAHGHRAGRAWVKLSRSVEAIPEVRTDVVIERIGPDAAGPWSEIVCTAFEMPMDLARFASATVGEAGWTHYLGTLDGTPVTAAAMHVDGDTAWLGFGATLEAARKRGGQRAAFTARLRDAAALGCTLAVTETGAETDDDPVNPSLRNMLALGFELAYERRNWVRGQ